MALNIWLLLAGAALAAQGCASWSDAGQDKRILDVPLQATRHNSGEIARATLVGQGERTGITFFIGGVPSGTSRPVHLYSFVYPGRCAQLGRQPAYEMNQVVLADRIDVAQAGWRLNKWLAVPLEQLRGGRYSLVVRASPADGGYDLFCGEID